MQRKAWLGSYYLALICWFKKEFFWNKMEQFEFEIKLYKCIFDLPGLASFYFYLKYLLAIIYSQLRNRMLKHWDRDGKSILVDCLCCLGHPSYSANQLVSWILQQCYCSMLCIWWTSATKNWQLWLASSAMERSSGSTVCRRGLGWALLRTGQCACLPRQARLGLHLLAGLVESGLALLSK